MSQLQYDELGYKKKGRKRNPRPFLITILCSLLFAYGLWEIVYSFTGNIVLKGGVDTLYPAINALMMVFAFVGLSGVWSMEKWGPVSFVIVITLKLLVDAMFSHFSWWYAMGYIPAVLFLLALPKMKKTE
ncbi:MAG: hypothetical protein K2Q24_02640 [Chitinophagaceae bacterium]|jgi:hypothetical protein|nr:hypothetical protein [Chitinophagaceae bacterium]